MMNKGKISTTQQTVFNLPFTLKHPYKVGLSKFVPIKNAPKVAIDKSKPKEKGGGGEPQGSSLNEP